MSLANVVKTWSRDESTQVGCAVRGLSNEVLAIGYNGLPRHIQYTEERDARPEKYYWYEHAERNAIYNAARTGTSLVMSMFYLNLFPCVDCARGIIQVGASAVVVPSFSVPERWLDKMERALKMLAESNIKVRKVDEPVQTYDDILEEMRMSNGC
jgi:dCMP deaminase